MRSTWFSAQHVRVSIGNGVRGTVSALNPNQQGWQLSHPPRLLSFHRLLCHLRHGDGNSSCTALLLGAMNPDTHLRRSASPIKAGCRYPSSRHMSSVLTSSSSPRKPGTRPLLTWSLWGWVKLSPRLPGSRTLVPRVGLGEGLPPGRMLQGWGLWGRALDGNPRSLSERVTGST